jgi:hypothetical protein
MPWGCFVWHRYEAAPRISGRTLLHCDTRSLASVLDAARAHRIKFGAVVMGREALFRASRKMSAPADILVVDTSD